MSNKQQELFAVRFGSLMLVFFAVLAALIVQAKYRLLTVTELEVNWAGWRPGWAGPMVVRGLAVGLTAVVLVGVLVLANRLSRNVSTRVVAGICLGFVMMLVWVQVRSLRKVRAERHAFLFFRGELERAVAPDEFVLFEDRRVAMRLDPVCPL